MYDILLTLHNWVRWVVIILGAVAFGLALAGWLGKRPWSDQNRKWGTFFGIAVDIQLLLGLLLYFVSPLVRTALQNLGSAGGSRDLSFFALEHPISMLLAVVFAHLGSALPRRVEDSQAKFKRAAIFFGLALLFILFATPWARPLLRF
jgi:hypothetical protein